MRTTAAGVLALLTLGLVACGVAPAIKLDAPPGDIQRLVGTWEGHYANARNGRTGSIVFKLIAGEDHAHGDVVLVPEGAQRGYSPYPGPQSTVPPSQALTIKFVRAYAGAVSGSLDQYWDPDTKCATFTTFRGTQDGDLMYGTFTSTCENTLAATTGAWRVIRKH